MQVLKAAGHQSVPSYLLIQSLFLLASPVVRWATDKRVERSEHQDTQTTDTTWSVPMSSRFQKDTMLRFISPTLPSKKGIVIILAVCYCICTNMSPSDSYRSAGCSKDYVQMYFGNDLNSGNLVGFFGYSNGRICDDRDSFRRFYVYTDHLTVYFHTDGSGSGRRGLEVSFTARG